MAPVGLRAPWRDNFLILLCFLTPFLPTISQNHQKITKAIPKKNPQIDNRGGKKSYTRGQNKRQFNDAAVLRLACSIYIGGWGGESNREIVSCRAVRCVRACARSGCRVGIRLNSTRMPFPFSLFTLGGFPFSPEKLKGGVVKPSEIK